METPDTKADRLIEEFIADALGPTTRHRQEMLKGRIWHLINEEKEEQAALATSEEEG